MKLTKQTKERRTIRGAGGAGKSGGGGSTATEDPDSLVSRSSAKLLEAWCEGEVEGPVNGLKSIFFDGTPIQDASGNYNFKNYKIFWLPGTQDQSYIPDFSDATTAISYGVRVKHDLPWIHTVTSATVDTVRINLRVPRLQTIDKTTGNIHGAAVRVQFYLQNNGGGYALIVDDTIRGKTTGGYVRTYKIRLTGSAPHDIKLIRVTADSISQALANDTIVDQVMEVTEAKLRYPNTALVGIEIDAENFANIPVRAYHLKGRKIQIPKNYNPITRVYDTVIGHPGVTMGAWDGTFKTAWTDNPAWAWYDMITNDRFGMGRYLNVANIDKYALYTIAQYCDQLVPDGYGGTEPRFRCNLYIQAREQAMKVLQDMASIFRGITYYSAGLVTAVQDRPYTSLGNLFVPENVIDGKFFYSGSSRRARHTVAIVSWNDMNDMGNIKQEYVEDKDAVALYGIREVMVTGMGCTSRGQAHRLGRWMLLTEQIDNDTISFATGQDGIMNRPGEVVPVQDPVRSGKTLSGRLVSATTAAVLVEKDVEIELGKTYQLHTLDNDGKVVTKNLTNAVGVTRSLAVSVAYTTANKPSPNTAWIVAVSDLQPELWRLVAVVPTTATRTDLFGIKYNASKFAAADSGFALSFPPTSILPDPFTVKPPGAVTLRVVQVLVPAGRAMTQSIHVSWVPSPDPFISYYRVWYRYQNGNWRVLSPNAQNDVELQRATPGLYNFMVIAYNTVGARSLPVYADIEVSTLNPIDQTRVGGLELTGQGNDTVSVHPDFDFTWRLNSPIMLRSTGMDGTETQDPYFVNYDVTIWNGNHLLRQQSVDVPHYRYTLVMNKQDNNGKAKNLIRIEVRIRDTLGELLPETALTVSNPRPGALRDDTINPSFRTIDLSWSNPDDTDLLNVEIWRYTGVPPTTASPPAGARRVASMSAHRTSYRDPNLDEDLFYAYWGRVFDTFEQPSPWLYFDYALANEVRPPETDTLAGIINDLAAAKIVFSPNGGQITSGTVVKLYCPTIPNLNIYYEVGAAPADPTNASTLYTPAGITLSATNTIKARIIHPFNWLGLVNSKLFTVNASGVVAPSLTPVSSGVFTTQNGTKTVTLATPTAADYLFYTKKNSSNNTDPGAPATPTHDGATPPAPTLTTLRLPGRSYSLMIPRGRTRFKFLAFKQTGSPQDSSVLDADFTIYKASAAGDPGDPGTPNIPDTGSGGHQTL